MDSVPTFSAGCFILAAFTGGLAVGKNINSIPNHSAEKEIVELKIELTKLNIKKLNGECN